MQSSHRQTQGRPSTPKQRFKEPAEADVDPRGDVTITFDGSIEIHPEEDVGSDPYNHTGRFKKNIR